MRNLPMAPCGPNKLTSMLHNKVAGSLPGWAPPTDTPGRASRPRALPSFVHFGCNVTVLRLATSRTTGQAGLCLLAAGGSQEPARPKHAAQPPCVLQSPTPIGSAYRDCGAPGRALLQRRPSIAAYVARDLEYPLRPTGSLSVLQLERGPVSEDPSRFDRRTSGAARKAALGWLGTGSGHDRHPGRAQQACVRSMLPFIGGPGSARRVAPD